MQDNVHEDVHVKTVKFAKIFSLSEGSRHVIKSNRQKQKSKSILDRDSDSDNNYNNDNDNNNDDKNDNDGTLNFHNRCDRIELKRAVKDKKSRSRSSRSKQSPSLSNPCHRDKGRTGAGGAAKWTTNRVWSSPHLHSHPSSHPPLHPPPHPSLHPSSNSSFHPSSRPSSHTIFHSPSSIKLNHEVEYNDMSKSQSLNDIYYDDVTTTLSPLRSVQDIYSEIPQFGSRVSMPMSVPIPVPMTTEITSMWGSELQYLTTEHHPTSLSQSHEHLQLQHQVQHQIQVQQSNRGLAVCVNDSRRREGRKGSKTKSTVQGIHPPVPLITASVHLTVPLIIAPVHLTAPLTVPDPVSVAVPVYSCLPNGSDRDRARAKSSSSAAVSQIKISHPRPRPKSTHVLTSWRKRSLEATPMTVTSSSASASSSSSFRPHTSSIRGGVKNDSKSDADGTLNTNNNINTNTNTNATASGNANATASGNSSASLGSGPNPIHGYVSNKDLHLDIANYRSVQRFDLVTITRDIRLYHIESNNDDIQLKKERMRKAVVGDSTCCFTPRQSDCRSFHTAQAKLFCWVLAQRKTLLVRAELPDSFPVIAVEAEVSVRDLAAARGLDVDALLIDPELERIAREIIEEAELTVEERDRDRDKEGGGAHGLIAGKLLSNNHTQNTKHDTKAGLVLHLKRPDGTKNRSIADAFIKSIESVTAMREKDIKHTQMLMNDVALPPLSRSLSQPLPLKLRGTSTSSPSPSSALPSLLLFTAPTTPNPCPASSPAQAIRQYKEKRTQGSVKPKNYLF